jgi:hypothetical protein
VGGVPDPADADDPVEQLVRDGVSADCRVVAGPVWLMVTPAAAMLPEQGWKLHVSVRAPALPDLIRIIVPVLVAAGCVFKVARSCRVLAELNDGLSSPASVGKAVTIYPGQDRVADLGRELAILLTGWPGPRILSDRRVAPSAPVYYRYGPFAAAWAADPAGKLRASLHGPDGEVFEGAATLRYRQPSWAIDPFTGAGTGEPAAGGAVLGGHYQITAGLRQAAQGNLYRAVDRRDGRAVVIKQARALVAEDRGGVDARLRLRNERRVLQALDGAEGVPRFVDHFQYGADEFLVNSDCGPDNLGEYLFRRGRFLAGPNPGPRSLTALGSQLARILAGLHGRGVIMRDLSPKNIVIGETGPCLVDFGIASYDGLHLPGATLGYAPGRQWRDEPPAEADDYHALGMTLLFAVSGLEPVSLGEDRDLPRVRALQTIASLYGERPAGIIGLIADLLSEAEPTARAAFEKLLSGHPGAAGLAAAPLPVTGPFTPQMAAEITDVLLSDLLKGAGEMLNSSPAERAAHDASIYQGSSGMGLELLHHLSAAGTAAMLGDLATFSVAAAQRVKLQPGLFTGTTGVTVFLQEAAARGVTVPASPWEPPGPGWRPQDSDLSSGAAGVGLGHLRLHQASGDPRHLAVAVRCGQDIAAGLAPSSQAPAPTRMFTGVDGSAGQMHGLAGVTEFLLALALRTGDQPTLSAATQHASQLADRTRGLLPDARSSAAPPIAMSWCQGLAGIGQVLLHAGLALSDPALVSLARQTADACICYVPRLATPGRCCGAAGAGNFLIDLAIASQDERYWQAALNVGRQILLRSGGPLNHPIFARDTSRRKATSWAFGIAGLLPFFRRLARQGEPEILPLLSPGGCLTTTR